MWNVVTLDGYFAGSKPWDLEFHQTVYDKELEAIVMDQLKTVDTIVFGRKTYQGMEDYWTHAEGQPETPYMNDLPKIVCSTTLETASWQNTTIVKDAATELPSLKEQGEGNMFVFGSAELSASLMQAGLFDEYRLCVAPVLLGEGRRLFAGGIPQQKLQLLKLQQLQNGGVILTYTARTD